MRTLLLALALLPTLSGCEILGLDSGFDSGHSDAGECPAAVSVDGTVSAQVAGYGAFNSGCVGTSLTSSHLSITGLHLTGEGDEVDGIYLLIRNPAVSTSLSGTAYFDSGGTYSGGMSDDAYYDSDVQFTISELTSTRARGTFSFTGVQTDGGSTNVTNGTFDVEL